MFKFKKIVLTTLLALVSVSMSAFDFEVNGIYYNRLDPGSVTVTYKDTSYDSYSGDVSIPDKIQSGGRTYIVTSIGKAAFYDCSGLTSLEIPSSVTSIGFSAFRGCSDLTQIKVQEGNTVYDSRDNCNAIIETASNTLVFGCKNTVIPKTVTSIGDGAFSGCTGLTSIKLQEGVTSIGKAAFYQCSGLTSIEIPSSVTTIGDRAFSGCSGLTSIEIPSNVTSIGEYAFYNCSGLTSIKIPSSVTSIESSVFMDCLSLTSIEIPSSVTSIGSGAFWECSGLTSIKIPSSVTSIGGNAFAYCKSLTSIELPSSVTSIEGSVFMDCLSLTSIEIPSSVTSIGIAAFSGCTGLTSIEIPDGVTTIGDWAFSGCSGLTSIEIPSNVTSIGEYAFQKCTGLVSIEIPSSVTTIEGWAFYGCHPKECIFGCTGTIAANISVDNIEKITLAENVTDFRNYDFSSANKLETLVSLAITPPQLSVNGFSDSQMQHLEVLVPKESLADYQTANVWKDFACLTWLNDSGSGDEKKCKTPAIAYQNKKLIYNCDTPNFKIHQIITCSDATTSSFDSECELSAVYEISAYATADGYNPSETVTAKLYWLDASLNTTAVKKLNADSRGILVQHRGNALVVSGLNENEQAEMYDISGKKLGTANAVNGAVTFDTCNAEKIVIVKIGKESIKVSL